MKRVLLLVVDGWTPRVFAPALERGELPLLGELVARGWLVLDCISIFPSITPAATASILTGEYPSGHGIAGMSWWNPATNEISYFGDDVRTVLKRGAGEFLRDFLLRLNGERLQAPTLFQLVERRNRQAACFNHLIFRGDVPHRVTHPWVLQWLPGVGNGVTVNGPSWLCLGDFVSSAGGSRDVEAPGGIFNRFGLDDEGTASLLRDLPSASALPDFTVAYFADYDFDSHDRGPFESLDTLRHVDQRLSDVFEHWGGLDRVLEDACVVMTADHGHSDISGDGDAAISLDSLLSDYELADPSSGWRDGDDLLVCPNMRAVEIFHRRQADGFDREVAGRLLEDERIDQVIWRAAGGDGDEFHVVTRDRGSLRFRRSRASAGGASDAYGGRWHIAGDPEALDLTIEAGEVRSRAYPNALERIASGIDYPRVGRLWATARPGYEFAAEGQSVHDGAGSHGTLHELDSHVPLLIAGAPPSAIPSVAPRIVDVAPICSDIMGIPFRPPAGASRAYPGASRR